MHYSFALYAASAALLLAGCGGSSSSENRPGSQDKPTSLFPAGERQGRLKMGELNEYDLEIICPTGDLSDPSRYEGTYSPTTGAAAEAEGEAQLQSRYTVRGTLIQSNESEPEHIALRFDATAAPSFRGVLRLYLPESQAMDKQRLRTGTVENTELDFYTEEGARLKLDLDGQPVTITW